MKQLYELFAVREQQYGMRATFCIIRQDAQSTYFITDSSAMHDEFQSWIEAEKQEATLVNASDMIMLSAALTPITQWYGNELIYEEWRQLHNDTAGS